MKKQYSLLAKFLQSVTIVTCLTFGHCYTMDLDQQSRSLERQFGQAHQNILQSYEQLHTLLPQMPCTLRQQYENLVMQLDSTVEEIHRLKYDLNSCTSISAHSGASVIEMYNDLTMQIALKVNYLESAPIFLKPFFDFQCAQDTDYAMALHLHELENNKPHFECSTTPPAHHFDPMSQAKARALHACSRVIAQHLGPTYKIGSMQHMPMLQCQGSIPKNGFGFSALPASLSKLTGAEILYYPSPRSNLRVPGTCGSRALANALGIRDTVMAGSLDAPTVYHLADTHNDLHSFPGVRHSEAIDMALTLNLHNTFFLDFIEQFSDGTQKNNPFSITLSTEHQHPSRGHFVNLYTEADTQANIINTITLSNAIAAFFLCVVDSAKGRDHCVLIAIVKQEGLTSKIIYMDCNNQQVSERSKSAAFLHYLYLQCKANK